MRDRRRAVADGEVRPVRGALAVAEGARRARAAAARRPRSRRARGGAGGRTSRSSGVESLARPGRRLRGDGDRSPLPARAARARPEAPDLADVRGQRADPRARDRRGGRAQPVPPGPARDRQDDDRPAAAVDPAAARARGGDRGHPDPVGRRAARRGGLVAARPFRAPHHTISAAGWSAAAVRRSPARRRSPIAACCSWTSSRSSPRRARGAAPAARGRPRHDRPRPAGRWSFPTRFMLVAAIESLSVRLGGTRCQCSQVDLARHRRRLSGPLLDRIDILMRVERPPSEALRRGRTGLRRPSASGSSSPANASAPPHRAAGDMQRPAHVTPDPRGRPGRHRAPYACSPSSTPPHALRPRPHPHPARRAHGADLDGSDLVGPEHINVAASLRLDDTPPLVEAA